MSNESNESSLQDTFSAFFGKAKDAATGTCECLYCERDSGEGGGRWDEYHTTWVCDEHIAQQDADEAAEQEEDRQRLVNVYGLSGRGKLHYGLHEPIEVGDEVEYKGHTFTVAKVTRLSEGMDNPNDDDEWIPAGYYVKIA